MKPPEPDVRIDPLTDAVLTIVTQGSVTAACWSFIVRTWGLW